MPATVVAQVEDQPIAGHLDAQIAVQLCPPGAHHVGHVEVAEPAVRALVGEGPAVVDPRLVAQRRLVGERCDDDRPALPVGMLDGRARRLAGGVGEQRRRTPPRVDRSAVDGDDGVSGGDRHAWCHQRRAGTWIGRLAGQDALHTPQTIAVRGQVGTEHPGERWFSGGRRPDVGMGRAELALHLPQHVDEVVGRPDALDERSVAVESGFPIDAVHVGSVVVIAHQPPGLVVHLPPLHAWLDDDAAGGTGRR